MSKTTRLFFFITAVASLLVLAYVLFRPSSTPIEIPVEQQSVAEEFESYLTDEMDYGLEFSRILAEKRIERAKVLAQKYPAHEPKAAEVIDSLRQRLARKANLSRGIR